MDKKFVDLHTHSKFSDGEYSPYDLVRKAKEKGLSAIALTDHDTVDGVGEAIEAGEKIGVEIVPGIELACDCCGEEVHIVGLFVDWKDIHFKEILRKMIEERKERGKIIIEKLNKIGIEISWEKIKEFAQSEMVGRLHVAKALKSMGIVKSINEAFDKYLGDNGPCYVPHKRKTPEEVIKIIEDAKGIPIIAHPQYLKKPEIVISEIAKKGIKGLEVYSPQSGNKPSPIFLPYVERFNLLQSGGSDFHGDDKGYNLLGKVKAPYKLVVEMKEWLRKKYGS